MYPAHLGTGQTLDLEAAPAVGTPELLSTHEYVATRLTQQRDNAVGPETNLYAYARNNPTKYVDPSGEVAQVVVIGCVCVGLYEVIAGIICASLYDKAVKKGLIGTDPGAHKKHCYVSCCLNKANLWIPVASPVIGVAWEICTLGFMNPRDAARDLEGDFYGIYGSYLDNCAKHCEKLEV